jgi:hypothetical protein
MLEWKAYRATGRAVALTCDPAARREGVRGGVRLAWSGIQTRGDDTEDRWPSRGGAGDAMR